MKAYWGVEIWLQTLLTSALDGGERPALRSCCFTSSERDSNKNCIEENKSRLNSENACCPSIQNLFLSSRLLSEV